MLNIEGLTLPVVNTANATITISFLVAGIAVALLVLLALLALFRAGLTGLLVIVSLVAIGIGGASLWAERERIEERRALEARIMSLDAQALAPESALACLDGPLGDAVDAGCERALFASAETTAAASALIAARLALVADGLRFAARDPEFAGALERPRRALEQDRFGIVAHVLIVRNGCTAERCDALVLLRDPTRVRANLKDRPFDGMVARYAAGWSSRAARAGATQPPPAPAAGLNFPSAASIPPVSIMNAEPAGAAPSAPAAPADTTPQPPRRPAGAVRPSPPRPLPPPPGQPTPRP